MTEENRKENMRAELERAAEALAAATLLFENGYISDAVSRLYYFVLYNVRALLLSKALNRGAMKGRFVFSASILSAKALWIERLPRYFQS